MESGEMMVVGAGDGSTSVLKVGYLAAILILDTTNI
jgi:hypothetical protein